MIKYPLFFEHSVHRTDAPPTRLRHLRWSTRPPVFQQLGIAIGSPLARQANLVFRVLFRMDVANAPGGCEGGG